MAWDGGGTFNRVHNFSADASAGIQAQAVRFDAEFDGIKTGLENCQTLTGETSPTANSPMGGFKHTGVAVATSTDNYLRADQSSNQVGIYVRDVNTGLSGTMSALAALFPAAYTDGQRVTVKVSADGSALAARVIKINGLSANIIDNKGSAVLAPRMLKDGTYDMVYDASASAFRAIGLANNVEVAANTSAITVIQALTSSGSFSATFTGFTTASAPSPATVYWTKVGSMVTVNLDFTNGESNAVGMAITNVPTTIQPTRDNRAVLAYGIDGGVAVTDVCTLRITTSATWTFLNGNTQSPTWAASSAKGFHTSNNTFSYLLD